MTKPAASVTNRGGASTKATITPLMTPITMASASAISTADGTDAPCWISIKAIDQDPAMIAIWLRSMPRLMTIRPMPRPSTPRIEMLRSRLRRFETVAKPLSVKPNTINSAIVIASTICS